MKTLYIFVLVVFCICSESLTGAPHDSLAVKYGNTIRSMDLSRHLHILASDSFLGRETGHPGQKLAAEYISKQFASFDIQPLKKDDILDGYYQKFPLELQSPYGATLTAAGIKYEFLNDFYYFPSFDALDLDVADVIFLDYGIEDDKYNDYEDVDESGKVLLAFAGEPTDKKERTVVTGRAVPS